MISGNESLGSLYCETIHYSSHHFNQDGMYDDESLEVYLGNRRR